jgi:hypothetical protein
MQHIASITIDWESTRRGGTTRNAVCSCGWIGPERGTLTLAADDAMLHERNPGDAPTKTQITVELTKEELMILYYVIPDAGDGDPLKDIYELEHDCDHAVDEPYKVLDALGDKIRPVIWAAIEKLPKNHRNG